MTYESFMVGEVPTIKITNEDQLKGLTLVDVRRAEEFNGELGHIKGANLITLGPDLEKFLSNAKKNEAYLFICRSGVRSANATIYAKNLGFNSVYNLEGGMMGWNNLGLSVE